LKPMIQGLTGLLLLGAASAASGQVVERNVLSLPGAKAVAAAAAREAARNGVGGAIAVVDAGGHVLYVERLDGTFPAATAVAIEKARTAAVFERPTRVFEEAIAGGRTSLVAVDVMTPLQGGVPVVVDGHVVGAIGVSGAASAAQDDELAVAGAAALAGTTASGGGPVTYLERRQVQAGFSKGAVLVDHGDYMVHASHREGPGEAEVHDVETDIMYVLDGTATLVTGGTVVDGRVTAPGETRGVSIAGGETRRLARGDVVVIPNGTPHWFREIPGPFDYYVVKVRATERVAS